LVIDGSLMTLNDLKTLATEAANAKVKLTIKKVTSFTQEHLKEIATLAPGLIEFDLTE